MQASERPSLSNRLRDDFRAYETYHQVHQNKTLHYVGIPLITASLLGLLGLVQLGPVNLGFVVWLGATVFYLWEDPRWGGAFTLVVLALWWGASQLPWPALVMAFAFGWVIQFLGHSRYEHKAPAFTTNLRHLLVGPLWIFANLVPSPE